MTALDAPSSGSESTQCEGKGSSAGLKGVIPSVMGSLTGSQGMEEAADRGARAFPSAPLQLA